MKRFWMATRFVVFLPVAVLLILLYVGEAIRNTGMWTEEWRAKWRRTWMSCWRWVKGEISTYDVIQ
jgi:hypothetical protein